ncbi:MAG: NAD(P)/FAD-dependent oxidoreductase [Pseudomonadota bacterium]
MPPNKSLFLRSTITHADVAIIGAGPAGGHAALCAAENGLSVALIDEQPEPGGQVWRQTSAAILAAPPTPESQAGKALAAALARYGATITHHADARVWQIERIDDDASNRKSSNKKPGNRKLWQLEIAAQEPHTVQARALIVATGAYEYVQPFEGWTIPGVIGLAGATALLKQDLLVPEGDIVVAGTGPLVFYVAAEIDRLGGRLAAIMTVNSRKDWLGALPAMMGRTDLLRRGLGWLTRLRRVPIHWRTAITRAHAHDNHLDALEYRALNGAGTPHGGTHKIKAAMLCIGHGLIPDTRAAQLAGLNLSYAPALGGWVPDLDPDGAPAIEGLFVCGDGRGIRGVAAAVLDGQRAGLQATAFMRADSQATQAAQAALVRPYARAARFGQAMTALSSLPAGLAAITTPQTIVCRCESLTRQDIQDEIDTRAHTHQAIKAGQRAGMGPCGGRFCHKVIGQILKACTGTTSPPPPARPPLRPIPLTTLAPEPARYEDLPLGKPTPL